MKLGNKVVLITGADSGIGQAKAEACAQDGADVAISYHTDQDGAAETRRRVEAAGRRSFVTQANVADPRSVADLFAGTEAALGTPDLLVANAGVAMSGMSVGEMDDAKLEQVIRTDLLGPLYCARAFIKARGDRDGGRILFIGSVAGHLPTPGSAPYGMAKAGVNSLVRSLSRELAKKRVNVNAIAPGLIATPMTQDRLDDPGSKAESMGAIPWSREGGGDRGPRGLPPVRRRRLRHGPDMDHGRRPDHELGRGVSAALVCSNRR